MVPWSCAALENPLFAHFNIFKNGSVAEIACTAPAPQRDFHHLLITKKKFIWRSWRITSRNDGAKYRPTEAIANYDEFLSDDKMQCNSSPMRVPSVYKPIFAADILRVLGPDVLQYCQNIASGFLDYLVRLPTTIMEKIIIHLNLEDVINLSYTCKYMHELCNDNTLWKELYFRGSPSGVNETVEELAKLFGWKKVFFTNKLQLQVQMRRLRLEQASFSGDDEVIVENEQLHRGGFIVGKCKLIF
ncbi:F-box protein 36 [Paragonimus westermani]|uniref:F-box protein 36 n=1 Tax=Paragonimus westermani TaxID=34504 RepID=A0A5J4NV61_9TREM|nr:F-box protein 36 [Paragonimus westermani]